MRRSGLIICVWAVLTLACNLSTTAVSTLAPTPESVSQQPTSTLLDTASQPTLPPLPNVSTPNLSTTGNLCQVYLTYSGSGADNKLSLRELPSVASAQVFRVPNNVPVLLLPNTQEVEADGYHWMNVVYIDESQIRYQGWMARDSYSRDGVRDPSIATLRLAGTQQAC
jgi:hypothetical protein